jgi:hypothetical protein
MSKNKITVQLVFSLLLLSLLASCGGGGGSSKASPEEAKSTSIYFPNEIQYKDSNQVLQESATMDVVFSDQNFTVSTVMYSYTNGSSDTKTVIAKKDVTMDYSGNILSDTTDLSSLNAGVQKVEYTYDKDASGSTIRSTYDVDSTGTKTLQESEKIDYTSAGKISKLTTFNGDISQSPTGYTTYLYDASGNLIEKDIDPDADTATPPEKHTYTYDAKGSMASEVVDDSENNTYNKYVYSYDDHGNKVLKSCYSWNAEYEDWNKTPDWSDAWYYVYNTVTGLPERLNYNKGSDATIEEYTNIAWMKYSAPSQASTLLKLSVDDIRGMFLSAEGAPTIPGLSN